MPSSVIFNARGDAIRHNGNFPSLSLVHISVVDGCLSLSSSSLLTWSPSSLIAEIGNLNNDAHLRCSSSSLSLLFILRTRIYCLGLYGLSADRRVGSKKKKVWWQQSSTWRDGKAWTKKSGIRKWVEERGTLSRMVQWWKYFMIPYIFDTGVRSYIWTH